MFSISSYRLVFGGVFEDILDGLGDLEVLVLGGQAVGRLEALAGDLEALLGVLGDAVRGHLSVEEVDDGEHQATLVHVTAHLDCCVRNEGFLTEDGSLFRET